MRKKTNFNPDLLKEELNRFKLLNEYSFITKEDDQTLILGNKMLEEEGEEDEDGAVDDISNELGLNNSEEDNGDMNGDMNSEPEGDDSMGFDDEPDANAEPMPNANQAPAPAPAPVEPPSDDVEVDVTEIVKGSEEAKAAADKASQNSEMLLQKLSDLESRISSMDAVSGKIAELEQEIIKRNPTPTEKLELQVTKSFPYSQSLEQYWSDKDDYITNDEKEKKGYTLTKDDIDNSYSEGDVKDSFNVKDDENDYVEEDI